MDEHNLDILTDGNPISSAYIRASRDLISKHFSKFKSLDDNSKVQLFKTLWKDEFDGELISEGSADFWSKIRFKNKNKKMMFLLRYSD